MVKLPFVVQQLFSKARPVKIGWLTWENFWAAVVACFVLGLIFVYVFTIASSTDKAKNESSQVEKQ